MAQPLRGVAALIEDLGLIAGTLGSKPSVTLVPRDLTPSSQALHECGDRHAFRR